MGSQPVVLGRGSKQAESAADRQRDQCGPSETGGALPLLWRKPPLLFTENKTNALRIFGIPNRSPYVKDGINNYVVQGRKDAVNPEEKGTKAAAHYRLTV